MTYPQHELILIHGRCEQDRLALFCASSEFGTQISGATPCRIWAPPRWCKEPLFRQQEIKEAQSTTWHIFYSSKCKQVSSRSWRVSLQAEEPVLFSTDPVSSSWALEPSRSSEQDRSQRIIICKVFLQLIINCWHSYFCCVLHVAICTPGVPKRCC